MRATAAQVEWLTRVKGERDRHGYFYMDGVHPTAHLCLVDRFIEAHAVTPRMWKITLKGHAMLAESEKK